VLLLLLPGLITFAAAIIVARLFPPLARAVSARLKGSVATRLAAIGLARGSGSAVVTLGFLTIAFALALVAEGYRSTLSRGEREQAAYAVPLDVTLREDFGTLVRVLDAAPLESFRTLAGEGGGAYPVLRIAASASRAERVSGVTVLGLDSGAIERLGVWRPEWAGGLGRADIARRVAPRSEIALRGARIAGSSVVLRTGPGLVSLVAGVETAGGAFRRIELGTAHPKRSTTLRAAVPLRSTLVSLEVVPPPRLIEGGANAGNAFAGSVRLTGAIAAELESWIGFDGVDVRPTPGGVDLRYVLTPQRIARVRARQATDNTPPRVFVSPRLAELVGGRGSTLTLQIAGTGVRVVVAGIVTRFPGTSGQVVVGDRSALRTAINAAAVGAARENEVWLAVPSSRASTIAAELEQRPFRVLSSTTRTELETEAKRDPLARGTLAALSAAAVIALLLAASGLALAVRSDLRDDRGELYDLEAQGAAPGLLRRVVQLRAAVLSVTGLVTGAIVGAGLVALVTRVVTVTARGGNADPPLAATLDPIVVVGGVASYVLLAAVLVGATTRRAFAEPRGPAYRDDE
jgi:hypothetical protein